MATTRPRRYDELDDELTSSVFQTPPKPASGVPEGTLYSMQPDARNNATTMDEWQGIWANQGQPRPTGAKGQGTRTAAPQVPAPTNNFDYSRLVGAPATNAAPPSTAAQPAAAPTRIDHRTYQPPGGANAEQFFAGLQPGSPVQETPGMVWQHDGQGWVQIPAGTSLPGAGGGPAGDPRFAWMQSQPYQPGEIGMDDLSGMSFEQLLASMGPDYTPTNVQGGNYQSQDVGPEDFATYDFNGWSGLPGMDIGAVGDDTDALIRRILANPESLDERTVARMKGASREEQSALQAMEDEELRGMGFDLGIEDSPWLRSERLESRRGRDAAVIASNRNIETEAAKTNAGDRRAAGALGASYVDSKGRLKLAQRGQEFSEQAEGERNKQASTASKQQRAQYLTGIKTDNANRALEAAKLRTQADVANNQNMFNAAKLRQDKVLGTVDADLRRAAATTDRLSLMEQAKQAAADLGISRDKVMADWLNAMMDDATQRYGIDVAAGVDREKLAQAGSEFQADLAFRIMALDKEMGYKYAALGESGRQFDYNLGLGYGNLYENARQHDDDIYARSQGF